MQNKYWFSREKTFLCWSDERPALCKYQDYINKTKFLMLKNFVFSLCIPKIPFSVLYQWYMFYLLLLVKSSLSLRASILLTAQGGTQPRHIISIKMVPDRFSLLCVSFGHIYTKKIKWQLQCNLELTNRKDEEQIYEADLWLLLLKHNN